MNLLDDILNEETGIDWNSEIDGKLTFLGVVMRFYENLVRPWNAETTRISYFRDFRRYVLPYLNDRPLEDYTKEDIQKIFDDLPDRRKENNQVYHEDVRRHFCHITNHVLKLASINGICPNVLWGSKDVLEIETEEDTNEKELVRLRKSLLPQEEIQVIGLILSDPEQSGQRMGLALMFCLGLRNAEACGADWNDIHFMDSAPETQYLLVYKTTGQGGNVQKFGGKTENVGRMIPIPEKLKTLLEQRRKWLKEKIKKGEILGYDAETLENLPIACDGSNFTKRCSSKLLTKEGTAVLERIGMEEDTLSYIDRDIRRDQEGIIEKDPTAYLFRRNLGTHLYLLGLSESEIQYIIGHEIVENDERRSNFRNEDKLYPIAQKMAQRPLVNDVLDKTEMVVIDGRNFHRRGLNRHNLQIPIVTTTRVRMRINQQEPDSEMRLELIAKNVTIQGSHTQHQNCSDYEDTLSVMARYYQRYREEINQIRNNERKTEQSK